MRIWKAIFSVLTIILGSLGLINIVSTDITLPIMFVFMGLTMLTNAKECYDKGAKKDAMIFAGIAIFVYVVTAYNLISRFKAIAHQQGVSVLEVKERIQSTIDEMYYSDDPDVQAEFSSYFGKKRPTPEEYVYTMATKIKY